MGFVRPLLYIEDAWLVRNRPGNQRLYRNLTGIKQQMISPPGQYSCCSVLRFILWLRLSKDLSAYVYMRSMSGRFMSLILTGSVTRRSQSNRALSCTEGLGVIQLFYNGIPIHLPYPTGNTYPTEAHLGAPTFVWGRLS